MRAVTESSLSHPAAIASSGFRSITQKQKRPPFTATKTAARKEINGGEVSATTTSNRRIMIKRHEQTARKLAKLIALRIFVFFPSANDGMRRMVMLFHTSRRAKRFPGLSYPRSLV